MKLPAGLVSAASVWPFVVLWLSENIMFLPSNRIPFRPLVLNQYYEIQILPLLPENREAEQKSKSPAPSPVWYDQEAFPCSGDWPLPKKKEIYTLQWIDFPILRFTWSLRSWMEISARCSSCSCSSRAISISCEQSHLTLGEDGSVLHCRSLVQVFKD